MKVERIALHGFLSHRDTDWSPNGARLVSLVGANGAGKSTLASDALRYALFGASRGSADDVVTLGQTDASVAVEFTYGGQRYRVVRGRTTKAGGKSSLDFAVWRDEPATAIEAGDDAIREVPLAGGWQVLTRDTIRDTEAAIAELLRLDSATFSTAVLLAQGEADAFAAATAGERKRILSTVLGLDVYAAAEARARELARDVDARLSLQRTTAERLEEEVEASRTGLEPELAEAREQLVEKEADLVEVGERRDALDARIRELDVALAGAERIAEQIEAYETDRGLTADAWRAAKSLLESAQQAAQEARTILADEEAVAAAAAELPAARSKVEDLGKGEAESRRLASQIADMERAIRDLEIPHRQAVVAWETRHTAAVDRVDELSEHVRAKTSVCQACGQPIEPKVALDQLAAARQAVKDLGDAPSEPLAIAQARAAKFRLESRQRELAWDPTTFSTAYSELTRLERIAARGESIENARRTLERAVADAALAEAERAQVEERGLAISARIEGLQAELAETDPFRAERSAAGGQREALIVAIDQLASSRRQLERAIATAEAHLAALEEKASQAARIRTDIAGDETEARRLRRLVEAFGVSGIPARIIAGVLPELADYANELLAELRPGMTLELRAQRARKSGDGVVEALDLVVRDPVGERPLAMFSGGERMSVSLALAVGLSRLVARRAGARIESLIVDEPDGLDAAARRSFGQALRVIAHRGDLARVVLVSHHEDLAELGDATYEVTKGPEGSVVELVT